MSMNFYQQIKAIEAIFSEFRVVPTESGFKWCFRCLDSSDEYENGEFASPVEALAHFTAETVKMQDEIFSGTDEDEDEDEDEGGEGRERMMHPWEMLEGMSLDEFSEAVDTAIQLNT